MKDKVTEAEFDPTSISSGAYHKVDATGLLCPEPVMMLHNKIRVINAGEIVRLTATDTSTQRDVSRFCEFLAHPLLAQSQQENEFIYWIKKKT